MNTSNPAVSVLPSILAYNLYGMHRSEVLHLTTKYSHVAADIVTSVYSEYFLRYATSSHILASSHAGVYYTDEGNSYVIIYDNVSRGELLAASKNADCAMEQFSLSFRTPKKEYNLPSYVLIRKQN